MKVMCAEPDCKDRVNSFALVSYIPEPLAGFLDRLRRELVPDCYLRAHVTILPPRPSTSLPPESAWELVRAAAIKFHPFEVELGLVEVFPVTDVIHISLGKGEGHLREMHRALNIGGLAYEERYSYHPHVTLAQELKTDELDELKEVAKKRWSEFASDRTFRVETLTFVQASRWKTWVDLDECKLCPDLRLRLRA